MSALPTFMIFRDGKTVEKVQGADPRKLQAVVKKLASEVGSLPAGAGGEASSSGGGGGRWKGAEAPRGYGDITSEIEVRGCELLNADEDFGRVDILFDREKPTALSKGKEPGSLKDWVESGADDQLLLFMPFQAVIKLHSIQVRAPHLKSLRRGG